MSRLFQIAQMDNKLLKYNLFCFNRAPQGGWLKTIRSAVGMTSLQLAKRVGLSRRRLAAIESSEPNQNIKLATLSKVAEGLGCDLCYALVPKHGGLLKQLEERATHKAREAIMGAGQHMSLENQLAGDQMEKQIHLLAQDLLRGNLKDLWDES